MTLVPPPSTKTNDHHAHEHRYYRFALPIAVLAGCGFPFDQVKQIANEKLFGFIMADVTYRDRLDEKIPHRTQFALKLTQTTIITGQPGQFLTVPDLART